MLKQSGLTHTLEYRAAIGGARRLVEVSVVVQCALATSTFEKLEIKVGRSPQSIRRTKQMLAIKRLTVTELAVGQDEVPLTIWEPITMLVDNVAMISLSAYGRPKVAEVFLGKVELSADRVSELFDMILEGLCFIDVSPEEAFDQVTVLSSSQAISKDNRQHLSSTTNNTSVDTQAYNRQNKVSLFTAHEHKHNDNSFSDDMSTQAT